MKAIVRKSDHINVLTIPKEIQVVPGAKYAVTQHSDGTLVYTPQHRNPFQGNWFKKKLTQTEEWH